MNPNHNYQGNQRATGQAGAPVGGAGGEYANQYQNARPQRATGNTGYPAHQAGAPGNAPVGAGPGAGTDAGIAGPGGATGSGSAGHGNTGIKHTMIGLHGAGEALRGSLSAAIDGATGQHQKAAAHRDVMERGIAEMRDGAWKSSAAPGVAEPAYDSQHDRHGRHGDHGRQEDDYHGHHGRREKEAAAAVAADEGMAGTKPRVIHESHLLNQLDPRVRPVDREAWADGVPTADIKAGNLHGGAAENVGPNSHADGRTTHGHAHGHAGAASGPQFEAGGPHAAATGAGAGVGAGAGPDARQFSSEQHDHGNRLLNKLDPRVDANAAPSNVDYGTATNAGGPGGPGMMHNGPGMTATGGNYHGGGGAFGPQSERGRYNP